MLQISQTENPMCSATIDQMRLRRAMTLPLVFQNVSSSGFQSEIQVGFGVLIGNFLSERVWHRHRGIALEGTEARSGRPQSGGVTSRMIGFDGRHQWRQHQAIQASCQTAEMQNLYDFQCLGG